MPTGLESEKTAQVDLLLGGELDGRTVLPVLHSGLDANINLAFSII
jgi:hypothetical protein